MKFAKDELEAANREFGGHIARDSSLEFALSMQEHRKYGDYRKLAYIWRAILIDHPFTDGNKRTALWAALKFAEGSGKKPDTSKLNRAIIKIASRNITSIAKIERMIRHALG